MQTDDLAKLYNDSGPYATVFLDVSRDSESAADQVETRVDRAMDTLVAAGAPDSVVEAVRGRFATLERAPAPISRVVVATERGLLLDEVLPARGTTDIATWDDLPDITAWLEHEDQTRPFVLALVDHEGGEIRSYAGHGDNATVVDETGREDPHEQKIRGGGLAHRRMQRTAENVWADNARAVADLLRRHVDDGVTLIVLAGDPASRHEVRTVLGEPPGVEVVELAHGGRARDGGNDALHAAVKDVLTHRAIADRLTTVHEFLERHGRGDAAVSGVADTIDAFVKGQVEMLLLDPPEAAEKVVVPGQHPGLELTASAPPDSVRADLALVAAAARTGADITIVPGRALAGAPAAALLRWSDAPA